MAELVTFTTRAGTRITCPPELAEKLGHKPEPVKPEAPKRTTRK